MAYPGDDNGSEPLETGDQLSLTGDDDVLPWLASDDDEYEDEGGGSDYRILVFAVVALLALGGILWAAKSYFSGDGASSVVADGSTVTAPEGPYKERPEDPGGQDVAGTGDLSYEVGEGVTREGHLAREDEVAEPSLDLEQGLEQGGVTPAARPAAGASPATSGGVGVQVGAFQSRESAETGWSTLTVRYEALQAVRHRVVEATVDGGKVYRLQAVAADGAAADALCRTIRNAGGDCQVKR